MGNGRDGLMFVWHSASEAVVLQTHSSIVRRAREMGGTMAGGRRFLTSFLPYAACVEGGLPYLVVAGARVVMTVLTWSYLGSSAWYRGKQRCIVIRSKQEHREAGKNMQMLIFHPRHACDVWRRVCMWKSGNQIVLSSSSRSMMLAPYQLMSDNICAKAQTVWTFHRNPISKQIKHQIDNTRYPPFLLQNAKKSSAKQNSHPPAPKLCPLLKKKFKERQMQCYMNRSTSQNQTATLL